MTKGAPKLADKAAVPCRKRRRVGDPVLSATGESSFDKRSGRELWVALPGASTARPRGSGLRKGSQGGQRLVNVPLGMLGRDLESNLLLAARNHGEAQAGGENAVRPQMPHQARGALGVADQEGY